MSTALNFDATTVPPSTGFEPVPNGEYRVWITESEMKPASAGTGQYLELQFEILDGEYKGRKLWDRLNLINQSEQAKAIAQRTLSAICHATGVLKLGDSAQLHTIPMIVKVIIEQPKSKEYDPSNVIKSYKADSAAIASSAPAVNAQPAASEKLPWE